ncbi:hypothetical protein [Thiolapillus brandeum]|uniref:Uncharacterized protein n=1 Tax=Thiolapillus brandeum TaxID=1076588 RepID=A0A7U6GHD1_9GAMM|nr:hypothetical protein [Thiolapillus brandeum]BAO43619.1 hypothetical protein TBH_C0681 [Thiolapillus brandeum]
MNHKITGIILTASVALATLDAAAGARFKARGVTPTASGGYSAFSAGGIHGPNGGYGGRAGYTTHAKDGSTIHDSGASWKGAYGQGNSSGSFTSDGQGNASGSRNTRYTTNSGASYEGNSSMNHSNGSTSVTHNSSCYDINGNLVSCPQR